MLMAKSQPGKCPQQILCRYFLGDSKKAGSFTKEIAIAIEPAVAFFVKAKLSVFKVSIDAADLRFGDGAFENNLSAKFGIGSFACNHAIKSQLQQPGIDGGLAASR